MKLRKLAVLATGAAAAFSMMPMSAAHADPGAAVCVIVGSVHLGGGVHTNPTVASSGGYNFVGSTLVCAGSVTGAATAHSAGSYADTTALGSFNGTFTAGAFAVGGNCSGSVAGSRAGPVVVGTLNNVNCAGTTISPLPTIGHATNGTGAVVLTFVPNPLTLNTCGSQAPNPAPLPPTPLIDQTVCDAVMQGAAVIVDAD